MLEEKSFISQFDIMSNGCINVRKTNQVLKDGNVIAEKYWRCCLDPNDMRTEEVLNEPYYYNLAQVAWSSLNPENNT